MELKEKIIAETDEMLEKLGKLVAVNSVRAEAKAGKPFGDGPAAALAKALKIADGMGFKTVNMDNYCGYAEMGEGKEIIGIAAHLDVVPAGDGWNTDPFTLTRDGDTVYGRGVSDDKGAVIASLYAMKHIRESGIPMNKRVRLLMGCAEETGSECMAYYVAHEEPVTSGFTPDGNFPGIYGEKGPLAMLAKSKNTKILSMNGGFVANAVCNHCITEVSAKDVDPEALKKALADTALKSFSVTEDNGKLTIDAVGVAAHASTPLLGVNAAGCTMAALQAAGMQDDFVDFYNSHIGTACDGAGIGLNLQDAYGDLTLCNGIVKTEDGVISCTIDIRVPVTFTEEQVREACAGKLEDEKGSIEIVNFGKSLFYPKESRLVQDLYKAYVEVTGDTETQPMVIGGGTYAKEIPGIIAFGCEFLGRDNHIHDANESLYLPELRQQVEIYAKAIENLLK